MNPQTSIGFSNVSLRKGKNLKCELCGFVPTSTNCYREKQDHLMKIHFNDKLNKLVPHCRPYGCPANRCHFRGKDKQALLRHFANKHGVLELFLQEELAKRGIQFKMSNRAKKRLQDLSKQSLSKDDLSGPRNQVTVAAPDSTDGDIIVVKSKSHDNALHVVSSPDQTRVNSPTITSTTSDCNVEIHSELQTRGNFQESYHQEQLQLNQVQNIELWPAKNHLESHHEHQQSHLMHHQPQQMPYALTQDQVQVNQIVENTRQWPAKNYLHYQQEHHQSHPIYHQQQEMLFWPQEQMQLNQVVDNMGQWPAKNHPHYQEEHHQPHQMHSQSQEMMFWPKEQMQLNQVVEDMLQWPAKNHLHYQQEYHHLHQMHHQPQQMPVLPLEQMQHSQVEEDMLQWPVTNHLHHQQERNQLHQMHHQPEQMKFLAQEQMQLSQVMDNMLLRPAGSHPQS